MNALNYYTPAIIALSALASSSAMSAPPVFKTVPEISSSLTFSGDQEIKQLKILLKQGDLEGFYEAASPCIGQHHPCSSEETLAGTKMDRQLLLDRLAAMVPLLEVNLNEPNKTTAACVNENDIILKGKVMNDLYVISKTNREQNRPLARKKEIAQLCSLYAALVIRMMKDSYCPDIEASNLKLQQQKEAAWREEFKATWDSYQKEDEAYERNWKQPESAEEKAKAKEMAEKDKAYMRDVWKSVKQRRELANMLGVIKQRNSTIGPFIKNRRHALLLIVLDSYPNQSAELFKYLKLAGYGEDEMMQLVDQVLGRTPQTEFLYKSNLGRKFLKEKEK